MYGVPTEKKRVRADQVKVGDHVNFRYGSRGIVTEIVRDNGSYHEPAHKVVIHYVNKTTGKHRKSFAPGIALTIERPV